MRNLLFSIDASQESEGGYSTLLLLKLASEPLVEGRDAQSRA